MKITVGTTDLEVTSCYAYRYPNGKLILKIELPQTTITHDELRTLLKENTKDIVLTKDDNSTESFTGFHYQVKVSDDVTPDGVEIHSCEVECQSENDFQIGIMQRTIADQQNTISTLTTENEANKNKIGEMTEYQAELLYEISLLQLNAASTSETVVDETTK